MWYEVRLERERQGLVIWDILGCIKDLNLRSEKTRCH